MQIYTQIRFSAKYWRVKFIYKNVSEKESPVYQRLNFIVRTLESGNQAEFARRIGVRSGVVGDMFGKRKNKPSFDVLSKIAAAYPQLRVDWLLLGRGEMLNGTAVPDNNSVPSNLDFHTQSDPKGNVQAPLINHKAAANYLAVPRDDGQYEQLDAITLPKHMVKGTQPTKGFYLSGDSMEPTFYADDIAVCQQVPRSEWSLLQEETVAIVVSNSRGLQLKRVTVRPALGTLRCQSDNAHSPSFDLNIAEDVREIWRFEWLLTKRCEKANQDLPEWRRQMEKEVGDLRYQLAQVIDNKELRRFEGQ